MVISRKTAKTARKKLKKDEKKKVRGAGDPWWKP